MFLPVKIDCDDSGPSPYTPSMSVIPIVIVALVFGFIAAFIAIPKSKIAAGGAAIAFFLIQAFAVFGFLARGEAGIDTTSWGIGYSVLFLVTGFGLFKSGRALFRSGRVG
jgi:hypothetical protein